MIDRTEIAQKLKEEEIPFVFISKELISETRIGSIPVYENASYLTSCYGTYRDIIECIGVLIDTTVTRDVEDENIEIYDYYEGLQKTMVSIMASILENKESEANEEDEEI